MNMGRHPGPLPVPKETTMKIPTQAHPVVRQASKGQMTSAGVIASGPACDLCRVVCDALPNPIAKAACNFACDKVVC